MCYYLLCSLVVNIIVINLAEFIAFCEKDALRKTQFINLTLIATEIHRLFIKFRIELIVDQFFMLTMTIRKFQIPNALDWS